MYAFESIQSFQPPLNIPEGVQNAAQRLKGMPEQIGASALERVKTAARNLGALSAIGTVESVDSVLLPGSDEYAPRLHQRATITRNGHRHALVITEPISGNSGRSKYLFHGITQDPTRAGAAILHARVAQASPDEQIVSFHSESVGELETKLTTRQAATKSFQRMSQARGEIGRVLFGDTPVHAVSMSMGTVHAVNMAEQNLDAGYMNLDKLSLLSPAIVTPDQARYVMSRKFLPSVFNERCEGTSTAVERIQTGYRELRRLPIACISNALYLSRGTEADLLTHVAGAYQVGISYGIDDPLAQPQIYEAAAEAYPDNVHISARPGGHSIIPRIEGVIADIASVPDRLSDNLQSYSMR